MKKTVFFVGSILVAALSAGQLKRQNSGALPLTQSDILLIQAKNSAREAKERARGSFVLKGKVVGQRSGYVYLSYTAKDENYKKDSCLVKNFEFRFEGNIQYPAMAYIYGNVKSGSVDDPNFTRFFLEPGVMTFVTKMNRFKDARITGSKAQDEYAALLNSKKPVEANYQKQLDSLRTEKDHEKSAAIRERLAPYFSEMDQRDFVFFDRHPRSYVTAYMLRFHVGDLTPDSLEMFYNRLGQTLQQTNEGEQLAEEIRRLRSSSVGSISKNFTATDIDGNPLRLSDFKGRYVLLDFWASWCVPCRKGNPHLKELYSKYKDEGFEIIGISDDDSNPEAWHKAVEKDALPWRHVLRGGDRQKLMKNEPNEKDLSEKYGIHTLPTKILIDPDGVIVGRYGEGQTALDKKLEEVFK